VSVEQRGGAGSGEWKGEGGEKCRSLLGSHEWK
jgi:hypothetical protein